MTFRQAGCAVILASGFGVLASLYGTAAAQLIDRTLAPNVLNEGIAKSLGEEIGAGRGDVVTPDSSAFIIARDPFRAIRRGRQLFQRKFTRAQGQGPLARRRRGRHQQPARHRRGPGRQLRRRATGARGAPPGSGGDVVTRPDSRDAPHLFGARPQGDAGRRDHHRPAGDPRPRARSGSRAKAGVTRRLTSKGIDYGTITADPDGTVDTSQVAGVDPDLRVRPFFAHGGQISIREFVVGALQRRDGSTQRGRPGPPGRRARPPRRHAGGYACSTARRTTCSTAPPDTAS